VGHAGIAQTNKNANLANEPETELWPDKDNFRNVDLGIQTALFVRWIDTLFAEELALKSGESKSDDLVPASALTPWSLQFKVISEGTKYGEPYPI